MPNIRWQDISDIKHNILGSLQKVSLIEMKAAELTETAKKLRQEIVKEVAKYNTIIERIPDSEMGNKKVSIERRKE